VDGQMNLPNKLTVTRIILSPIFMVAFLVDNLYSRYLALFIFVVAALTDLYDGHLARKTGVITSFGKFMDPLADKLLTSTALVAFLALGYVKSWIVLPIIVREIFITGLRAMAAYRGVVIPSSILAKWKTATQMVVIVIILVFSNLEMTWSTLGEHHSPVPSDVAITIFNGLLLASMILTLVSGIDYIVKNAGLIKGMMK
jgi:CDP-diacylglycerol--glycerol-3-phosphate 3-phosphatidyltransferase